MSADVCARLLVHLLRIAGVITVTAFLAILMPVEWMAASHRWLGLGEFPRAPVVEYLARSAAALYGFHGVLILLVATDPVKYRAIVTYIAIMNVLFGLIVFAIDLHAGMPAYWTFGEGPPIAAFGGVIGYLNSKSLGAEASKGRRAEGRRVEESKAFFDSSKG